MASESHSGEVWRSKARLAGCRSRPDARRPGCFPPLSACAPAIRVGAACALSLPVRATAAKSISGYACESIPPAGRSAGDFRPVTRWFDSDAFAAPGAYFGSSANGVIKGPKSNVWDFGVFKAFPIREGLMVRWELTAVNLLNHPNYNDPTMNITAAGARGVIGGVGGLSNVSSAGSPLDPAGPRGLRMGLRIEF
jgi:hypothetical protein